MNARARPLVLVSLLVALLLACASLAQANDSQHHVKRDYDSEIAYYKGLAESGSTKAQESLALIYSEAATRPGTTDRENPPQTRNYAEAIRLLTPLVEAERPKAMARLAVLEAFGIGLPINAEHAFELAEEAADHGVPEADWLLSRLYFRGRGTKQDDEEAVGRLDRAARSGYGPALLDLATYSFRLSSDSGAWSEEVGTFTLMMIKAALDAGLDHAAKLLYVPYDYNTSLPRIYAGTGLPPARDGRARHPALMRYVGLIYLDGRGVVQNADEGLYWLNQAADQGHGPAQINLAEFYNLGFGVPRDEAMALKWIDRAVDAGDPSAKAARCAADFFGALGVPKDEGRALNLCREAAEAGDPDAYVMLAEAYANARGVPRDDREAFRLYLEAAKLGEPISQYEVGNRLRDGFGVERNLSEGVHWLRRSAHQGDLYAELAMANALSAGEGVPRSDDEALMWLIVALGANKETIANADPSVLAEARALHDRLMGSLQPDEVSKAKTMAAAFKPRFETPAPLPPGFVPWN